MDRIHYAGDSLMDKAEMDRLAAVYASIDVVRRGGTVRSAVCMPARPTSCR